MKISIVIPIHNEEDNIQSLSNELIGIMDSINESFEIILINDGSVDGSAKRLNEIASGDNRLKIIHLLRNYGQTCAMMAGFDHASGDIIIAMDGDNQNDPSDIPKLIDKIKEGYDVVSGWRKNRQDARISRIFPSVVANWLISKIGGIKLHDYGCSLKAYNRDVIKGVKLYGEMHRFIPVFTSWRGAKVTEIVVNHRPRSAGESHYGINRVAKVLLDLALIKFQDRYMQHPIHFFGGFGLLNFMFAIITFAMMLYYKFWGEKTFIETPLPTLTILFILMGMVAILLGILAEINMRTYYESQKKKPYRIKEVVSTDRKN